MKGRNSTDQKQQKSTKPTKAGRNRVKKEGGGRTRKALRVEHRLHVAAECRNKETFQVPMNAEVELASLPAKARDKIVKALPEEIHINKDFTTGPENDKQPIMVPDPMRGKLLKGTPLRAALQRREIQADKCNRKRAQRQRFATLTPGQKYERRLAGHDHRKPRS